MSVCSANSTSEDPPGLTYILDIAIPCEARHILWDVQSELRDDLTEIKESARQVYEGSSPDPNELLWLADLRSRLRRSLRDYQQTCESARRTYFDNAWGMDWSTVYDLDLGCVLVETVGKIMRAESVAEFNYIDAFAAEAELSGKEALKEVEDQLFFDGSDTTFVAFMTESQTSDASYSG